MAAIQGTMLYAAELSWKGQKGVEGEDQAAVTRGHRGLQDNPSESTPTWTIDSQDSRNGSWLDRREGEDRRSFWEDK